MIASLACPSQTAANDESSLSPEALWQTCLLALPRLLSDKKGIIEAAVGERRTVICLGGGGLDADGQA